MKQGWLLIKSQMLQLLLVGNRIECLNLWIAEARTDSGSDCMPDWHHRSYRLFSHAGTDRFEVVKLLRARCDVICHTSFVSSQVQAICSKVYLVNWRLYHHLIFMQTEFASFRSKNPTFLPIVGVTSGSRITNVGDFVMIY